MNNQLKSQVREMLVRHEGYREHPYFDTEGNITIGVGYNLSSRGMPKDWILDTLEKDIEYHYQKLEEQHAWFKDLSEVRQGVLVNMRFNLGSIKFNTFQKMLAALANHDYSTAAKEMLNSKWASQVHSRANELANIMEQNTVKYVSSE